MRIKASRRSRLLVDIITYRRHPKMTERRILRSQPHIHRSSLLLKKMIPVNEGLKDCEVDLHNKKSRGVEVLKLVKASYTTAMNLETDCLIPQAQRYNSHIFGNIAGWMKFTDIQMRSSVSKPSDSISIHAFLHMFKTAFDINEIHEGPVMWPFPHFMKKPTKAVSSYRISATEYDTTHKEGTLTI